MRKPWVLLVWVALVAVQVALPVEGVVVNTPNGPVRGTSAFGMNAFLGIPFAVHIPSLHTPFHSTPHPCPLCVGESGRGSEVGGASAEEVLGTQYPGCATIRV